MTRPIIVPLDGSPFAETVLPRALHSARMLEAPLDLVFVATAPFHLMVAEPSGVLPVPVDGMRAPTEYLADVERRLLATAGVVVTRHVLDGAPASAIAQHAAATGAQLIVLATHGRGGLSRFILGSVADRLVRAVHCPLLLMRPGHVPTTAPTGERRLVVPLDGSPVATSIIEPALDIMAGAPPALTLVHVVPLPPVVPAFPDEIPPVPDVDEQVRVMTGYLEEVAVPYRARGIAVRTEVRVAESVATAILAVAGADHADCLAMTTSGRGGAPRLLLGSVADKVVRGAEGAVILWNPPREHV